MLPRHRAAGFTVVELLVVVAIIGVLAGLLLPAIQSAREAARLVQCKNHLKQIALACLNYESGFRQLPGYAGEQRPFLVNFTVESRRDSLLNGVNWIFQAAMFMEDTELSGRVVGLNHLADVGPTPEVRSIVSTTIRGWHCPTRRSAIAYPLTQEYAVRFGPSGARTDYAICGGTARQSVVAENQIDWQHGGVWSMRRRVRYRDIADGLSQTYLVGEKAMDSLEYDTGHDFGDRAPLVGWNDTPTTGHSYVRFAARQPIQDHPKNCLSCHDFGSAHIAGWNAARADGSVDLISFFQDLQIHHALGSIDGREVMSSR